MRAVLLSDTQVANYLKENFVLTWRQVRPAPKVTIDYGNGETLTRTLKGNTAFYVCRPDGTVVDILPGVYTKADFLQVLPQSRRLAQLPPDRVRDWHRQQVRPVVDPRVMASKAIVESPILDRLALEKLKLPQDPSIDDLSSKPASYQGLKAAYPDPVKADSQASLSVLRPAVHRYLGAQNRARRVGGHSKTVFREILKVDLDDPYLGLKVTDIPGTP